MLDERAAFIVGASSPLDYYLRQDTRLRRGMSKLLQSKFKLGAGVEIVVGPVNCSSTAQTEAE